MVLIHTMNVIKITAIVVVGQVKCGTDFGNLTMNDLFVQYVNILPNGCRFAVRNQ